MKKPRNKKLMTRKILVLFCSLITVLLISGLAKAQQKKVPRIGVLSSGSRAASSLMEAFLQGLRDLGYIEGQNLLIEYRYGEGKLEQMPTLVNELLQQKVDMLLLTNQVA